MNGVYDIRRVGAVGESDERGGLVIAFELKRSASGGADGAAAGVVICIESGSDHHVVGVAGEADQIDVVFAM